MEDDRSAAEMNTLPKDSGGPSSGVPAETSVASRPAGALRITVMLVVLVVLAAVLAAKLTGLGPIPPETAATGKNGVTAAGVGSTMTAVHNDATADFKAALLTGKPVFVLFHSLTCKPCVEISAAADRVMPEYEGKVVFVNALTEDGSSRELASRFTFQYIPASFFVRSDGTVADSFIGPLSDADLRTRLDKLIAP